MVATASRKTVSKHQACHGVQHHSVRWDKKMSNNCAAALLVYTMMQIFFVLGFIETRGISIGLRQNSAPIRWYCGYWLSACHCYLPH